jgi:hypothetical protein
MSSHPQVDDLYDPEAIGLSRAGAFFFFFFFFSRAGA